MIDRYLDDEIFKAYSDALERAQSEMSGIAGRIAEQYPDIKKGWGATVDRLVDRVVNDRLRLSLLVMMAAVGAVLMIGCANVTNLLLARAVTRQREIGIRLSLGATRRRLIRQLLTESLLLALAAAAAGLLISRVVLAVTVDAVMTSWPPGRSCFQQCCKTSR